MMKNFMTSGSPSGSVAANLAGDMNSYEEAFGRSYQEGLIVNAMRRLDEAGISAMRREHELQIFVGPQTKVFRSEVPGKSPRGSGVLRYRLSGGADLVIELPARLKVDFLNSERLKA